MKRLCCVLVWLLLLLPALQAKWQWVKEPELHGAFTVAPRADFSFAGLWDSSFQPALEHYLEDRIGFRSWFIQLRNQLAYSVFHESWASRMTVGQHGVLFAQEYIDGYLGLDYVGDSTVRFNTLLLRDAQDSLARHGVQLVFVIAPSKVSFMPENLPASVQRHPRTRTNYEAYAQALPAAGIHLLDFGRAFRQWKPTSPYPLFTSGGLHWSMYGGARAADSLQHYLRDSLRITPRPFRVGDVQLSTTPRDTDDDLVRTLNLPQLPFTQELAYPKLLPLPTAANAPAPDALLIADSFAWTWINNDFVKSFSDKSRYWYYNSEVVWPDQSLTPEGRDLSKLKNRSQYLSHNVIILMFNEWNLAGFDKGFGLELFNIFHPFSAQDYAHYNELMAQRQAAATWEESVKEDFDFRNSTAVHAILDRERVARVLGQHK